MAPSETTLRAEHETTTEDNNELLTSKKKCAVSLNNFHFESFIPSDTKIVPYMVGNFGSPTQKAILNVEVKKAKPETYIELLKSPKHEQLENHNDKYYLFDVQTKATSIGVKVNALYPATEEDFKRCSSTELIQMAETPELYKQHTLPLIEKEPASNTEWIRNIFEGTSEQDRILHRDPDFLVCLDMKHDASDLDSLYMLAIVRDQKLRTLRDITAKQLPLLTQIMAAFKKILAEKFPSVSMETMRSIVHYLPSYFQFHVHFMNSKSVKWNDRAKQSETFDEVIDNISNISSDYYQRRTLFFSLPNTSKYLPKQ